MPKTILGMVNEHLHTNLETPIIAINKEGKLILINEAAAEIFSTDVENAINKKIWDIISDHEYTKTMFSIIRQQIREPQDHLLLINQMIFNVRLIPVKNKDNRIVASLALLRDYSNMHNLEKNIMHTLTEISHKLRTPLTSIKGFIDTLLESRIDDKKTMGNFLEIMHEETNRMSKLINNTLTLSSIANERIKAETKPADISDIVSQALLVMQPQIKENKVKVKTSFPKNPAIANVNRDNFIQAITNILDNSIKFSSMGKKKGKIDITVSSSDGAVTVEIQDNGIGISSRDRKHIFEKFYHIRNTPASHAGIGLGLSITKKIIEDHYGTINCKSTMNKGTLFTITLPIVLVKETDKEF
ncbi:MAG: HAMP domain-containing sensor histidine kinase [Armatimonadota bacterium]